MPVWKWVCTTLVIAFLVNGSLLALALWQRADVLNAALHETRVSSATISSQIENSLDQVDRTLSGIGEVLKARPDIQGWRDPYAHRLLMRRHAISPWLRSLFLVGTDAKARNSSATSEVEAVDLSDRDYFIEQTKGDRDGLFIGRPIQSRLDRQWVIPISRGLEDQFGNLQMVVGGAVYPQAINDLISRQVLPNGYRVAILLPDGTPIGCQSLPQCAVGADFQPIPQAQSRLPAPESSGFAVDFMPGTVGPGAYVRGPTYGILVAVVADQSAVLKPWKRKLPLVINLALAGTIGLAGTSFALFRQVQRKRQALADLEDANAFLEHKVSERTRELRDSEGRLRSFIMAASDAVIIIDQNGIVEVFNPSASQLFGYEPAEIIGKSVNMLMPEANAQGHNAHLKSENLPLQRTIGRGREMTGRRKDGSEFPIELSVGTHIISGAQVHVGVIRDITERKANEDMLRRLANTDGLTGVLNRRSLMEEGELLFSLAKRHGRNISALMIDADHFKSVNDTYGHDVGDIVLKKLAASIAATLRNTDIFGRLGGEEFVVILPETDEAGAEDLAQKIVRAASSQNVALADGRTFGFTVSVGIGSNGTGIESLDGLLKQADMAVYVAKQSGRNRSAKAPAI